MNGINPLSYHTQVYGSSQSGKTYLALRLLNEQTGIKFFVDTKNEIVYHKFFNVVMDLSDLKDFSTLAREGVLQNLQGKMVCLLVDPISMMKDLTEFLYTLFMYQRSNPFYRVTVLIDEFQEYKGSPEQNKKIRAVFLQGLSKNIRVILTSQGWSMVDKNIRNNCEITVILKQRKRDIEDMMDLGLIQYDLNDQGHRIPKTKFDRKYQAYMEVGINGKFYELRN
jgi:AAA+ ATPase superfamily predicted ATPase